MKKKLIPALLLICICITVKGQQSKIINNVVRQSLTKENQTKKYLLKESENIQTQQDSKNVPATEYKVKTSAAGAVQIGTAPHIFTQLSERCRTVDADPELNAVSFTHRNSDGGFTSSQVRYDISFDGGNTFTSNIGPLNPDTPNNNGPNGLGRYPQGIIYSSDGTTANAKIIYQVTTNDYTSSDGVIWDGFTAGSANLTDGTDSSQIDYLIPNGVIPGSLTKGLPGEFWSCDVFLSVDNDHNLVQGDLAIYKGVLNGNEVNWTTTTIPANTFLQDESGALLADPVIAFSDDGMIGYLMVGGVLAADVESIGYSPLVWTTEDGGANWIGPKTVNLDKIGGYADTFAYIHNGNIDLLPESQFPGELSLSYADSDIVVDKNGDMHIGCLLQTTFFDSSIAGFDPHHIPEGNNFVVDIVYDKSENDWSMIWPDPAIAGLAQIQKYQDTIIYDRSLTSDARLHMSKDIKGEKIFITYADDVDNLGDGDNVHRDFYGWGYDVNTCKTTNVKNLTGENEDWYGKALLNSVAPRTFDDSNGTYTIPTVFTEIIDPYDQLAPVQFWYYQEATFEEDDFAFDPAPSVPYSGTPPVLGEINTAFISPCEVVLSLPDVTPQSTWDNQVTWYFGDGTSPEVSTINQINPFSHTFSAGNFTVTACATNKDGTTCTTVDIAACDELDCKGIPNGPNSLNACGACVIDPNKSSEGCTDVTACNFNPIATCDDGSCSYCCNTIETFQLNIPMPHAGWHLISSHCHPTNSDIETIFAPIVNEILQVKDLVGNVYIPSFNNFNNGLHTWDINSGYIVKTADATTLTISGSQMVDLNTESIPLYKGWNLVAYWLQGDADPVDIFDAIAADVIQVKDLSGTYIPSFNNFNNLGHMHETKSYLVKMSDNSALTYNRSNVLSTIDSGGSAENTKPKPEHFIHSIKPNPNTSTLVVLNDENNTLNNGDEFGIFTQDDILVGAFVYENDMMGGLVFGDDETEDGIDGILENETYKFKVWNKTTNTESEVEMNFTKGNAVYKKDDLCVVSFKESASTGIQQMQGLTISANPNPASSNITFDINISQQNHYKIEIYQINGKLMEVIADQDFTVGQHQINYNLENLNDGLYLYKVSTEKTSFTGRFTVLK